MAELFDWALVRQAWDAVPGGVPEDWILLLPQGTSKDICEMAERLVDRDVEIGPVAYPCFVDQKDTQPPERQLTLPELKLWELLRAELNVITTKEVLDKIRDCVLVNLAGEDINNMDMATYQKARQHLIRGRNPQTGMPIMPGRGTTGPPINSSYNNTVVTNNNTNRLSAMNPLAQSLPPASVMNARFVYVLAGNHRQFQEYETDRRIPLSPSPKFIEVSDRSLMGMQWNTDDRVAFTGTWNERSDVNTLLSCLSMIGVPNDVLGAASIGQCTCPQCVASRRETNSITLGVRMEAEALRDMGIYSPPHERP